MRWTMLVAGCALAVITASPALADDRGCCGRGGREGPRGARFDPSALTTISGEVVAVHEVEGRRGSGIHLDVRSGSDVLDVHLGPSWYLDQQKVKFAAKDKIEVTGSKMTMAGKPGLVATEAKKGGEILALRDANGIPVWAGHHRH